MKISPLFVGDYLRETVTSISKSNATLAMNLLFLRSDRVRLLKETLLKQKYLVSACDYVSYVSQSAIATTQELQEVAGQQEQLLM